MVTDSLGFMICGGAGTRLGSRRSGSFTHGRVGLGPAQPSTKFPSSSALLLGLILMFIPGVSGVVCSTCQDTIHGCGGGADCPLLKTPMENAASLVSGATTSAPDLTKLLPPELLCTFTKTVMETLCAVARAPKGGGSVDLSSSSISSATGVVKAAINGFCTWEEAGLELAGRLEAATNDADVTKLSAALTLLKATGDKAGTTAQAAVQSGMGLYTFVWAKIGSHLDAVQSGTVRILAKSSGSSSSTDLTAKIRRPRSDSEFHYMLFLFIRVVAALGVSLYLLHDFLSKVVFNTLQLLHEDFKVAHELLLIYIRAVETDASGGLHLGNVYDRGNGDTFLAEARQNAAVFFRSGGGDPRPGGAKDDKLQIKWNGKHSKDSKKPCVAFNLGKPHQQTVLMADGCCKFSHSCMQWVSDKGSRGMCGGDHAKVDCDYDAAKKRDAPLP